MLSSDLATRWQPAGTCPCIRRRSRWLLVVGLDGVVGGELPVLQPGELLDRRVILRDHRPALFIGQFGALHHPLRILVVFSGQRGIAAETLHQQIGRAACRERVCQSVSISGVVVYLKTKYYIP